MFTKKLFQKLNFKSFSENTLAHFDSKCKISKYSDIYRFNFINENHTLNFEPGQKIQFTHNNIDHQFFPISKTIDKGFVDLVIDRSININLEEGEQINLITSNTKKIGLSKNIKKLGLIALGSKGIIPLFQIVQSIFNTKFSLNKNTPGISLIYYTKYIEEMALCDDLVNFDSKGKINFFPVVEYPDTSNWTFGVGKINAEMINNLMPHPNDKDGKLVICISEEDSLNIQLLEDHLKPILMAMGYEVEKNLSIFIA